MLAEQRQAIATCCARRWPNTRAPDPSKCSSEVPEHVTCRPRPLAGRELGSPRKICDRSRPAARLRPRDLLARRCRPGYQPALNAAAAGGGASSCASDRFGRGPRAKAVAVVESSPPTRPDRCTWARAPGCAGDRWLTCSRHAAQISAAILLQRRRRADRPPATRAARARDCARAIDPDPDRYLGEYISRSAARFWPAQQSGADGAPCSEWRPATCSRSALPRCYLATSRP